MDEQFIRPSYIRGERTTTALPACVGPAKVLSIKGEVSRSSIFFLTLAINYCQSSISRRIFIRDGEDAVTPVPSSEL